MPIVDGLTSTKMIRSHEKCHPNSILSQRAAINGRVPIFAVSASLVEKERDTYISSGFDGWILKPIDFKRLSVLMDGIVHHHVRDSCLYEPGRWEQGGWFCSRQSDLGPSSTTLTPEASVSTAPLSNVGIKPQYDGGDEERDRLNRLDNDAIHARSFPAKPGTSGSIDHAMEGK